MAYFLFKNWHENLFQVKRENVVDIKSKLPIEFIEITKDNMQLVEELRGKEYLPQFEYQLSLGDFGYYAYYDGKPIGYGWAKHASSDDYFFEIDKGCVYLCRFFVHEKKRGQGIYPSIISALIEREKETETFYIAAERGNASSERGLKKVGFKHVKEYGFLRGFKHTFNKKKLM